MSAGNWPTGRAPFVPNGTALMGFRLQAGAVEERDVLVRITPTRITTSQGDRYDPATGTWQPRKGARDFMRRGRWLVSVTPDGGETKTYLTMAQRRALLKD